MNRHRGEGTIYRRKDGRFEVAIYLPTAGGVVKRIRRYATSRVEAEAQLVHLRETAHQGLTMPARTQRLHEYLDYWLPIVKRTKRPTTYVSYESIVRNYLKPGLGMKPLASLSVADVQRYLDSQLVEGRSVRTVQKQRMVLSAALTRAQHEELLVRNVAHHVEIPVWLRKDITPWTIDELSTFLAAARSDPLYPVFLLLALYGLRCGEVLGLSWRDIDFQTGRIHVRQQLQRYDGGFHLGPIKTNAGTRDLPLLDAVRAELASLQESTRTQVSDLVFQTRFGNPIEGGNVRRSLRRISKATGLPLITLHHLRHTTATLLKNMGVPARDAQLILGHAHITTTQQLYQHADLDGQRAALTRLEKELWIAGVGRYSRQKQPSWGIDRQDLQRSNIGGSSQTRTGDTRLFRSSYDTIPSSPTEVNALVRRRAHALLLGGIAVIFSRQ